MRNVFYILTIIVGVTAQSIAKKPYTEKNGEGGVFLFTAEVSFFALLFFAVTSGELEFNTKILPYSAAFAVFYCLSTIFNLLAISNGSLTLTSLFISYSLMIPTFYGLICLNDPIGIGLIPGIILLAVSIFLTNGRVRDGRISGKWIGFTVIALTSNGMCTVVQKAEQIALDGAYKNEFMIISLLAVTVVMLVFSLIREKKSFGLYLKSARCLGAICGIMNGVVNLFVMLVTGRLSVSLVFPLISAGGIIATAAVSWLIYREKLSKSQLIGLIFGVGAVVLLNI